MSQARLLVDMILSTSWADTRGWWRAHWTGGGL